MSQRNMSDTSNSCIPPADDMKFGIVVSDYNSDITETLFEGAYNTLIKNGAKPENIIKKYVAGGFELTLAAQWMADYTDVDAVISIGCIIKGETYHFDYICDSITQGITQLNHEYGIPFIFGVLTTENYEQAKERSGGRRGNKGNEAAVAAIRMVALHNEFLESAREE